MLLLAKTKEEGQAMTIAIKVMVILQKNEKITIFNLFRVLHIYFFTLKIF